MSNKNIEKIYCYVDETGQDTKGKLFVVVAVIVGKTRDQLLADLCSIEKATTTRPLKWNKTRTAEKKKYIEQVLKIRELKGQIYFQVFNDTKAYEELITLTIAQAINLHLKKRNIGEYLAHIVIDGLGKTEQRRISKNIRLIGIKASVRGARDESNALIRLADVFAGFARETVENRKIYCELEEIAKKRSFLNEI